MTDGEITRIVLALRAAELDRESHLVTQSAFFQATNQARQESIDRHKNIGDRLDEMKASIYSAIAKNGEEHDAFGTRIRDIERDRQHEADEAKALETRKARYAGWFVSVAVVFLVFGLARLWDALQFIWSSLLGRSHT